MNILVLVVPFLVLLSACTRNTESANAKFTISVPSKAQNSASSSSNQLVHVAINVTGPGISSPIFFSWDGHQNGSQVAAAPTSFDFEVPRGENRLVQALAVYESSTTQTSLFTYGDVSTSFNAPEVVVNISLTEVGSGNLVSGQVSGRYLTGADTGPTGIVDLYYSPGNGKPSLIVDKSFMASGWFSLFMLSGANIEYKVAGQLLFGGPVSIDSPQFVPAGANGNLSSVTRVAIPRFVREEGGGGTKTQDQPMIMVWGYFGDSSHTSGKFACNDLSSGGAFTNLWQYNSVPASANTLLTLNNVTSPSAQSFPSSASLLSQASPLSAVFAGGGTVATCTNSVNAGYIPVRKAMIDGRGKDSAAGFRNVFVLDSNGNALAISATGSTASIAGTVLPNIWNLYNRIKFYRRTGAAGENFRIETPICQAIANGASGFVFAGEASSIAAGTGAFTASNVAIDTTSAEYAAGRMSLVACAASGPSIADLAPVGMFQELYSNGGSSGPYLRLELLGASSTGNNYLATNGMCYPIQLKLYQVSGGTSSLYNAGSNVNISNLNPGSTWYEIHTNAACNSAAGNTTLTISSGTNTYGTSLWVKPTVAGNGKQFSSVTASGDGVSFTASQNQVDVGSPSISITGPASTIVWNASNPLSQQCYLVTAKRLDASGMSITSDSNALVVPFTTPGGGFSIYDSISNCQTNASPLSSSFSFSSYQGVKELFVRASSSSGSLIVAVANFGSYLGSSYTFASHNSGPAASPMASKFLITTQSQNAGLCNRVNVTHVNSGGTEIPVPAPSSVKLTTSSTDVVFYSDPMCTSILADGVLFLSGGVTSAEAYFMPVSVPSSTFTIGGSSGSLSGESTTITVATPSAGDQPYMTYSIPKIKSVVLGAHDFATSKTITFAPSSGATITCEKASSPSFTSWSACSGQLVGNVFTWTQADAVAALGFRFNLSAPGKPTRTYNFIPREQYKRWNTYFEVKNCDVTLTANGTTDFAAINTALSGNSVVCLNAGTFTHTTAPPSITPGSGKVLIGSTDANGNPTAILQAVNSYNLATVATTPTGPTFANLDMRGSASGSNNFLVNMDSGTGSNFKSYNNIYQVNAAHNMGMRIHGDQAADSYGDTFVVDGTVASSYGILSTNSIASRASDVKSALFKLSSHGSTAGTYSTALKLLTSNSTFNIFDLKVDPGFNAGAFLVLNNTGYTPTVNVLNSTFSISGISDNSSRFPISITNLANLNLNGVSITNSMPADLINTTHAATSQLSLQTTDTKLINFVDKRILYVGGPYVQSLSTTRTQFVRASGAGNSSKALDSASPITWTLAGPATANPNTAICGVGAGTTFAAVSVTAPTYPGSYAAPTITNSANATDLSCQIDW